MPGRKNLDRCEAAHGIFDAQLALRDERIAGQKALEVEHWTSHDRVHIELARSLAEYKRESNEWRATIADLRGAFLLKTEFQAKHDGLRAELFAEVRPLEARLATAESWQIARDGRERGVTTTLTSQRSVLLVVGSIIGTVFALASLATLVASIAKP